MAGADSAKQDETLEPECQGVTTLKDADATVQADKEAVIAILRQCGSELQWASQSLKADKDVVSAAVQHNASALQYASEMLKSDKHFIFELVHWSPEAIQFASESARSLKGIIFEAVRGWPEALRFASETLRSDKDFVVPALRRSPFALQWTSETLQSDKEVVLAAMQSSTKALQWASESIRSDATFLLEEVRNLDVMLKWASPKLRSDRQFVLNMLKLQFDSAQPVLGWAAESLRSDREFVMEAVKVNPEMVLAWASQSMRSDKEVLLIAVQQAMQISRHTLQALQSDREVMLTMICTHGRTRDRFGAFHRTGIFTGGLQLQDLHPDVSFLHTMLQEYPSAFAQSHLFHVSLLSGRSCCIIKPPLVEDGFRRYGPDIDFRFEILTRCLDEFDLESAQMQGFIRCAELFCGTSPLPDDDAVRRLRCGQVHELQLLLRSSSQRRRLDWED